ncbi:MAG: tol-pal system-associated acyl-CoA thioesterase [Pseudomonadota bacterium]
MSDAPFSLCLRVYMEDTDSGGIVYYVNYLKFMERARTEFMRSLGFGRDYIFNHDLMFVVRDVALRYRSPARLDDELTATATVSSLGGASIVFRQQVRRGEEELVGGDITVACVDRQGVKARRLPPDVVSRVRSTLPLT